MLGRMHVRVRPLHRAARNELAREARAPGVAEPPADPGPLAGPFGLVAVEEAGLRGDGPRAYRRDGNGTLEDLRQVMVHGIAEERPDHRIVGAERREAFAQ